MAEIATIARPYAEALFQALGPSVAQAWLDALAAVTSDRQLLAFADHPKTTPEQVLEVIQSVIQGVTLPREAIELVRLLLENGRLAIVPEIARQYRRLSNARAGVADAVVESAFELTDVQVAELADVLQRRFGRQLQLTVKVVPELIGGVRVAVGDEVLDTSVKARLEQMKAALTA